MGGIVKGFKGSFSMAGIGGALAVFAVFVALAYLGWTPSTVAAKLKGATA